MDIHNNNGIEDMRNHMPRGSFLDYHTQQKEEIDNTKKFRVTPIKRFYILHIYIPLFIAVYYATHILFPPGVREKVPFFIWSDGELVYTEDTSSSGDSDVIASICPRESICSEGWFQILLIAISRLTAFASYVFMAHTFLSKCHSISHALSVTYASTQIPFTRMHIVHKFAGRMYALLAVLHTIGHFIRWIVRKDFVQMTFCTQVGLSGLIAILAMGLTILIMSQVAKNKEKWNWAFEMRFTLHWVGFWILFLALCFHTKRCRILTCIFSGVWLADYIYGFLYKTHRLDVVEFAPLPDESGVQLLWRNPPNFKANSGEYVQVRIPWLQKGAKEFHPFSIYMKEGTKEGLNEVLRQKYDLGKQRVHFGVGGAQVNPSKTAIILVEFQNEFASEDGNLYPGVSTVMKDNNMINNTVYLVEYARTLGAHIFHAPIVFDGSGQDNPNYNLGILKACHTGKYFVQGTWNAEIIPELRPQVQDVVVQNKKGLDCFIGTDLQEQLEKKGIETVMLAGFLTNCCVESTMRTAYEKGYNVITLEDGTACNSLEEQAASTSKTYKMFSTPMKCEEAMEVLGGNIPERFEDQFTTPSSATTEDALFEIEKPWDDLESFIEYRMSVETDFTNPSIVLKEAREHMRSKFNTTQVFMTIAGDWTKEVYQEVSKQTQRRHVWIRGPYISPYAVTSSFNHLILVASGIGITPALGVMGQYTGFSRTKILIWSTRCALQLKFFTPLIKDTAMMAIIYYTGKETLSEAELNDLYKANGNIFIQQTRPKDITKGTTSSIITTVSSLLNNTVYLDTKSIPMKVKNQWCILYCGGSKKIRDMFRDYSKEVKVNFEYELFDW